MNEEYYSDGFKKRFPPYNCPYCNYQADTIRNITNHIKKYHPEDTLEVLKCRICKIPIRYNMSGCCGRHIPRKGSDNSFYGKKHTPEVKEHLRKTSYIGTKKLWENEEYRNKIISGISKPRPEKFKKEQSIRIKQWYVDNPEQKLIRSEKMKETWSNNHIHAHPSHNESEAERQFIQQVKKHIFDFEPNHKETFIIEGQRITPDYVYRDDYETGITVVEFYGDHWHANPNKYKADDVIHPTGKTAEEIWEKDKKRINLLKQCCNNVLIIWESDLKDEQKMELFWQKLRNACFHS